jgi:hypothetical protein
MFYVPVPNNFEIDHVHLCTRFSHNKDDKCFGGSKCSYNIVHREDLFNCNLFNFGPSYSKSNICNFKEFCCLEYNAV